VSDFKEWDRNWTDEQLEQMLLGGSRRAFQPTRRLSSFLISVTGNEIEHGPLSAIWRCKLPTSLICRS
jgi:hypothetical protein